MPLPRNFRFSQSSLQDYVDCPRRFQLRHVLMQPWPALITSSPGEFKEHQQRGRDFHHLAHQHALGIDLTRLEASIHDPLLLEWWRTFLARPPAGLPETVRRAEVVLSAPLGGYRLLAKLDLLAVESDQRLVVVDWKATVTPRPTSRSVLARRMQTLLYRYLAVEAGAAFFGGQCPRPEQVEMVYWFANAGGSTERFPYDAEQHTAAREQIAALIANVAAHQEPTWPLTPDERLCRFCNYRSYCERDVQPGFLEELDEDLELPEFEIDLEQIAEVEF